VSEHLDWRLVLEEHRDLLRSLERVEKLIHAGSGQPIPPAEIATLRGEIYRLHGALEHHYQSEEKSFFHTIEADHPELASVLETFRREHVETLETMRAILDRALSQREESLVDDVRDKLIALFAQLRDHEHRETALVQDTVARDLGVASS
jgi:hemerythrin-like domain-containing protein